MTDTNVLFAAPSGGTATPLHIYSVRGVAADLDVAAGTFALPIGSLVASILSDGATFGAAEYNPNNLRVGDTVVIQQTGVYDVSGYINHYDADVSGAGTQATTGMGNAGLRINGTVTWFDLDGGAGLDDSFRWTTVMSLTAGDIIELVTEGDGAGGGEDYLVSLVIAQRATGVLIDPTLITPTILNHAFGRRTLTQTFTTAANEAASQIVGFNDISVLSGTPVLNEDGDLSLPAGTYRVEGGLGNNNTGRVYFRWYVNGVVGGSVGAIAPPSDTAGQSQPPGIAVHEFTLAAPGIVKLAVTGVSANTVVGLQSDSPTATPWFSVQQLPAATVVDPGTVPVETLHKYSATMSAATVTVSSASLLLSAAQFDVKYDPNGMGVGNTVVIQQSGVYSIDVASFLGSNIDMSLRVNGASVATGYAQSDTPALHWLGNLVAGDIITITTTSAVSWGRSSVVVQQLPTATVIDPGAVPVNDQAASGYFDIGTMRMQWIKGNYGNGTNVVLPAAFADTNYVVTSGSGSSNTFVSVTTRTTSGFTVVGNIASAGTTGGPFPAEFIAIGRKP